jgi:RNA polymerase sigma factor (sigma-70 family)
VSDRAAVARLRRRATDDPPPALVARARAGDPVAVGAVLRHVEVLVHSLALRALWHPADAEDCAQDALLAVARGLPAFRGDSRLTTWATAITLREVARHRAAAARRPVPAEALLADAADPGPGPEDPLLAEELGLVCASGLLTLLSVPVRLAYVLGDVLGCDDRTAAGVLGTTPAAFRQRLSRARRALRADLAVRLATGAGAPPSERARRASAELDRLAAAGPAPDLATPDLVAGLRTRYPALLGELAPAPA